LAAIGVERKAGRSKFAGKAFLQSLHHALDVTWLLFADLRSRKMQDEAEISISGVKLTHEESMTVRVAIDTLANVLAEGLGENENKGLTDLYLTSLSRIQRLLESREPRKQ
jgi:hypothetical protein